MFQKVMFKPNKNQALVGIAVLAIAITGILIFANSAGGTNNVLSFLKLNPGMSTAAIAKQSVDYLNKSVLQQGQTASLISATQESGVVKMKIKIADKEYDSYATSDGKLLFPEAFTIDTATATKTTAQATPATQATTTGAITPANVTKVAKTMLEAYVVSSCPFGLQIQRALSEAIKNVPSLAQYVTVRYIGSVSGNTITSMHGTEEAQENLRQICIRDEQQSKYWNYVSCYMKKATGTAANGMPYGDSKTCQATAGIDTTKLNACVADSARGLSYAKADFAAGAKLDVQGSPTLALNGAVISEDAFGGRSADSMRNIICSSSSTEPDFCKTKLDTTSATYSFSLTYAAPGAATATASTAPAAANTNCAPAAN